ncbi:MAG: hypothetical protein A3F54_01035 [Candidatus Kerfeldbacteria bacterium RIFCSPHIGHO2_12_FULL_48_17]|uniref:Transcription regulator TrmB N-terminal domain-containing protein n=1 Tax=Candidatus Kerfeldbacteria bacterium RIFCSPHIGHO2_12_FULL_48_17 TaxID=1798542 RepID=A0A1G2AXI1_9BACT|nr:MAG: hypothetical protein A3F54_01035 [Candidatus Kerfeldbacteria bacterium RIFCSPHIGHO2_12_FULL_48_17]
MDISILKKIGFSDKTAIIYLTLLQLGPSSVRALAAKAQLNRGTTYDALKWLQEQGVVNYFHKDTRQYFVAEAPEKLQTMAASRKQEIHDVEKTLTTIIPELKSLYDRGGEKPVARYFEGKKGVHQILDDVLQTTAKDKERLYRIYSAVNIREHLYQAYENYNEVRVKKKVKVKAIAIGEGGQLHGLDERKWISARGGSQTYILIYLGKTGYISIDAEKKPFGVVIENRGVYETQKIIFDELWKKL